MTRRLAVCFVSLCLIFHQRPAVCTGQAGGSSRVNLWPRNNHAGKLRWLRYLLSYSKLEIYIYCKVFSWHDLCIFYWVLICFYVIFIFVLFSYFSNIYYPVYQRFDCCIIKLLLTYYFSHSYVYAKRSVVQTTQSSYLRSSIHSSYVGLYNIFELQFYLISLLLSVVTTCWNRATQPVALSNK